MNLRLMLRCAAMLLALSNAIAASAMPTPQLFAPGIISGPASDGSPAFTPDGKTLFFTEEAATWSVILESRLVDGNWTKPEIAPFSGRWSDGYPAMSPDGSYIVYVSQRPSTSTTNGSSNLYRVNRVGSGWSDPVRLPDTVNISASVWRSSIASDGSIYFMAFAHKASPPRLYCARFKNGAYQAAQSVAFSSDSTRDVDPQIAPDQSFFVFSSSGRGAHGDTLEHLYITHRVGSGWGAVTRLRYTGDNAPPSTDNEPTLSPDARALYFASDRTMAIKFPRTREQAVRDIARVNEWDNSNTNVWSIPLAP